MVNFKKINYSLDSTETSLHLFYEGKKKSYGFSIVLIVLGLMRIVRGDFVFSIIPILAGAYFIYDSSENNRQVAALNVPNKEVKITPSGVGVVDLLGGTKTYDKDDLGDLEIANTTLSEIMYTDLFVKDKNGKQIVLLRADTDKVEKADLVRFAEDIVAIWEEG